jgi:hypothetical protein
MKLLSRRTLTALVAAGAVLGGALVFRPGVSVAAAFGGGSATLVSIYSSAIGTTGTVRCAGDCLVGTAEQDDFRSCPLRLTPKASFAGCLTALNAACATTCKSTP